MRWLPRLFLYASVLMLLPRLAGAQAGYPVPPTPPAPHVAAARPTGPMLGGPPDLGAWWKNSDIVREISLSTTQVSHVEQIFFEHRMKLIDLRADLEKQELRLQPLVEADQPDENKVGAQIDSVLAARGRLEKANAMMMLAIRRVLSVEQWKKLQTIQQGRAAQFHGALYDGPSRPGASTAVATPRPPQE